MFFSVGSESEASFSQSVRNSIEEKFRLRSTPGQLQLRNAVKLGILPADYQRNAAENGMLLCPNCHAYLTQNFLVLSLPIPVLEYLCDYVRHTPKDSRKPLHEVFDLLLEASRGKKVELPDAKAIFPYLGLFTLVTLNPAPLVGTEIPTRFVPPLSIIHGKKFVKAPSNTSPTSENVARIFESLALTVDSPCNHGPIPISPDDQAFNEKRYWRIPVPLAPIFAALTARLEYDYSECQDIRLATIIHHTLVLQHFDEYLLDENNGPSGGRGGGGPNGGSGPNDENEDGAGPSRGGRATSKRKGRGVKTRTSPRKGVKKARKSSGGSGTNMACGESGKVPPRAWFQNQQYDRWEISSSTCIPVDAPAHLMSTSSSSKNGLSISAQSPQVEDNPAEWQFGPSFTTNKIVFTASGIDLT